MQSSMRDKALALLPYFRVFKLQVNGKLPIVEKFYDIASREPAVVHAMWTDPVTGESLHNNIGVLTGEDFCVVDIDIRNGKHGMHSLSMLEDIGLPTGTVSVRTPSGGMHLYYALPRGITVANSTNRMGQGIDVRGYHGYVVGAGSMVDGKAYTWLRMPTAGGKTQN